MTQRKDILSTTVNDGVAYVPFRDTPMCDRCATFFMPAQSWYLPSELTDPICGTCLEDVQYECEAYLYEMNNWAWMQEHGLDDADMREPSPPMFSMPF